MTSSFPKNIDELTQSLLWPMNLFYTTYDRQPPQITPLFGQHFPEPYKQLLVHDHNMTPTLEVFHGSSIYIECIHVMPEKGELTREVILRLDKDEQPVEYGASHIFMDTLPSKAVVLIEEGRVPLGTVLRQCGCQHRVEPAGYFKIKPTPFFKEAFVMTESAALYGRRHTLVGLDDSPIAEVCEVIPLHRENSQ